MPTKTSRNLIKVSIFMITLAIAGCLPSQPEVTNGKIIFQSSSDGNYDLYIMNSDGSEQRNITNSPPSDIHTNNNVGPVASPDGTRIAFQSDRDGNSEIYIINLESGVQRNLTMNSASDYSPTWSPDGIHIAFISDRDAVIVDIEARYDIWTNNIYIMNADGSDVYRLTSDNTTIAYNGLAWSPDGKTIALSFSSPTRFGRYFSRGINLLTLSDLTLTRLTFDQSTHQSSPKWDPTGEYILYMVTGSRLSNIYSMNRDGTNQIALSRDPNVYDTSPSWSPDGKQILFSSRRDGSYHIYVMNVDGTNLTQLTNGPGEESFPVWLPEP